jgi:hypothetical protein
MWQDKVIVWIGNLFRKPSVEKLGKIKREDLNNLFKDERKDVINLSITRVYNFEAHYDVTDKANIENFLKTDWVNMKIYSSNYDCDDFALQLFSNFRKHFPNFAFGFCMSGDHAFNLFVDNNKKVWIIEPQNDKILEYPNPKYKPLMVLI